MWGYPETHILQVAPSFYPYLGGQETYVRNLSNLVRMGHTMDILTSNYPPAPAEEVIDGIWVLLDVLCRSTAPLPILAKGGHHRRKTVLVVGMDEVVLAKLRDPEETGGDRV